MIPHEGKKSKQKKSEGNEKVQNKDSSVKSVTEVETEDKTDATDHNKKQKTAEKLTEETLSIPIIPASSAAKIMPQQTPTTHQPQAFTDEELSEIFQIDFAEIFGSPDAELQPSKYKGVQLPSSTTPSASKNVVISDRNLEDSSSRGIMVEKSGSTNSYLFAVGVKLRRLFVNPHISQSL